MRARCLGPRWPHPTLIKYTLMPSNVAPQAIVAGVLVYRNRSRTKEGGAQPRQLEQLRQFNTVTANQMWAVPPPNTTDVGSTFTCMGSGEVIREKPTYATIDDRTYEEVPTLLQSSISAAVQETPFYATVDEPEATAEYDVPGSYLSSATGTPMPPVGRSPAFSASDGYEQPDDVLAAATPQAARGNYAGLEGSQARYAQSGRSPAFSASDGYEQPDDVLAAIARLGTGNANDRRAQAPSLSVLPSFENQDADSDFEI